MPSQALSKFFKNWFTLGTARHANNIRWSGCLKIPSYNTELLGRHSVNISVIFNWNYLQKLNPSILFYQLLLCKLMSLIKKILYIYLQLTFLFYVLCIYVPVASVNTK